MGEGKDSQWFPRLGADRLMRAARGRLLGRREMANLRTLLLIAFWGYMMRGGIGNAMLLLPTGRSILARRRFITCLTLEVRASPAISPRPA